MKPYSRESYTGEISFTSVWDTLGLELNNFISFIFFHYQYKAGGDYQMLHIHLHRDRYITAQMEEINQFSRATY